MKLWARLRRIPWWIWALLAPAVILLAMKLVTGGAAPVPVVGAGALSVLRAEDAPEGVRYRLELRDHEDFEQTAARVDAALGRWPDVIVLGLDAEGVRTEPGAARACETLKRLARHAENATAAAVVVNLASPGASDAAQLALDAANRCWREQVCARGGRRVCLDLTPYAIDPAALREAVRAAVLDARGRHDAWRASTQVGR